jgi:DNA polymerase-3 subunit gamma/tau
MAVQSTNPRQSTAPHLVLARKWRPDRFADLVGQEHVTRTLAQALGSGRIAHAFLFTGIRGVGKTTAARILARCLNCEKGPTQEPCGECAACGEIRAGRALDVVEIDGATYRKIDDARAIIENLTYRPARDRYKIYIIDEAHQLTDQAFNALLKTLEEPPPHVKFILATTEPQKMPETILSRLQRYDFRRIPFATIVARLNDLAAREGVKAESAAITLIGREAGGSMRDAERMLETAIALSSGAVNEAEVAATLGVASRSRIYGITEAILSKDAASALATIRQLYQNGANLEAIGRDLLETIRNLSIAKLPSGATHDLFVELPDQEVIEIQRLATTVSLSDLMRLFRLMAQVQEDLIRSPYPDLLLEMAAVRMATIAPVIDAEELLRAIGAVESKAEGEAENRPVGGGTGPSGGGARRLKVEGEVKAMAPLRDESPQAAPAAGNIPSNPDDEAADLPDFRAHIKAKKAPLAGFMEQGAWLGLNGDVLTMRIRNEVYVRYLGDNKSVIGDLASEFYGRKIAVVIASNGAPNQEANSPAPPQGAGNGSGPTGLPPKPSFATASDTTQASTLTATPPASSVGEVEREHARAALYADPAFRGIMDEFQGRLVDVRKKPRRRES